ncbi:BtpA/SgcQ family protein [Natronolimnohabitans innermongolicus]|uniref:Photosystem I assembly BtpA n=1 Tax=Natronolimnohabitans innermongolicus JCM 12255 TaxID=1227499 RepID=L9XJ46_9EURY|nr:BtpA/SgcQ family protein [Natronolimnohabitans innermongolicus]ELY61779.1 photosystem I assembly BtpA [Natronolimnohabitans innermongolicus JCM 12255]
MTALTPLSDRFDADRPVLGMVHLPPLPGSPGYDGDREVVRARALEAARRLEAGGVDGIVLENFGDAPFYPDDVPKHVVAEMTAIASRVANTVDVPLGINVLRNDAEAALAIAAAVGADFIRVNVHVGTAATDQGVLEGRAHETVRLRDRLEADVAILADVHVKHATPVGDAPIERVALETIERGRADGVIVSGSGTGSEAELEDVERVVDAISDGVEIDDRSSPLPPVFVGSGVTSETVGDCFEAGADGVIVGTALKENAKTTNPVSRERVAALVSAARTRDAGDSA